MSSHPRRTEHDSNLRRVADDEAFAACQLQRHLQLLAREVPVVQVGELLLPVDPVPHHAHAIPAHEVTLSGCLSWLEPLPRLPDSLHEGMHRSSWSLFLALYVLWQGQVARVSVQRDTYSRMPHSTACQQISAEAAIASVGAGMKDSRNATQDRSLERCTTVCYTLGTHPMATNGGSAWLPSNLLSPRIHAATSAFRRASPYFTCPYAAMVQR